MINENASPPRLNDHGENDEGVRRQNKNTTRGEKSQVQNEKNSKKITRISK